MNDYSYRSFVDVHPFPFAGGAALVYNSLTGARVVMPVAAARLVQSCDSFASLENHQQALCDKFKVPEVQRASVLSNLEQSVRDGLLISLDELFGKYLRAEESSKVEPAGSLSAVGIPTCNRPSNLRSCLQSYAQCVRKFDRKIHFYIADDSRSEAVRVENMAVLQDLKRSFGLSISYVGLTEKQRLVDELSRRCEVPRSILEFAFLNPENCPVSTGANRNALLVATLGTLHIQTDDDTTCHASPVPGMKTNMALSSKDNPNHGWFDEIQMDAEAWELVDVFSLHERLLGRTVLDCISGHLSDLDVSDAGTVLYQRLGLDGGKVIVTGLGTAGDAGLFWSHRFLTYDGESRDRLMQSERVYRQTLESHRQVRGVICPTISDSPYCISMNLGIDNRGLIPPFMPVQRRQDAMFARLVDSAIPGACFGFMPWTISHGKPGVTQHQHDYGRNRIADICWMLLNVESNRCLSADVDTNLKEVGTCMLRIGSMRQADFEELVRTTMWRMHTDRVWEMESLLAKYNEQPDYWACDVRFYISQLKEALVSEQYVVPCDLAEAFGDEQARAMAPRIVRRFGEVLVHWSSICDAARGLYAGSGFATEI